MGLQYPKRQSQQVLFKEEFINDDYFTANGGTKYNSPTINNGVTLDGTNQYLSYGKRNNLGSGSWSFTFKVSIPVTGVQTYLVSKHEDTDNRWYIRINTDGRLFMYSKVGGATVISATSGAVITSANTEYTVEVVGDRSDTLRFYVNGVESVGTVTTFTAVNLDNDGDFEIGRWNTAYGAFTMTFFSLTKLAHTEQEALDIYNEDTFSKIDVANSIVTVSPQAYFDDGSNIVVRNQGIAPNCIVGNGSGSNVPELLTPRGAIFTGSEYYNVGDISSYFTDEVTVIALVRPIDIDGFDNGIFKHQYAGGTNCGFSLDIDNGTNIRFLVSTAAGSSVATTSYAFAAIAGRWVVLMGVFSEEKTKLYVENILKTTGNSKSGNITFPGAANIGREPVNNNDYWHGYIGRISVYNFALTPTQAREWSNQAFNQLNI